MIYLVGSTNGPSEYHTLQLGAAIEWIRDHQKRSMIITQLVSEGRIEAIICRSATGIWSAKVGYERFLPKK